MIDRANYLLSLSLSTKEDLKQQNIFQPGKGKIN